MRLVLVMAMLALFHGAGIAARDRFPGFSTTMHALGTISSGAAIALVGQIFNMQEHWPAAVMLWAFCALAGWALLGDEFQQTLALLLVPAWLISEWTYRANVYSGSDVFLYRMIAVIAAVYLTAYLHSRRRVVFGILFAVAGIALAFATGVLAEEGALDLLAGTRSGASCRRRCASVPVRSCCLRWCLRGLSASAASARRSDYRDGVRAAVAAVHPAAGTPTYGWSEPEPTVAMYALVAAVCVFLAWWGVRESSKAIVNYGIAAFALTVMWFYFSDIMGKLDRSLGLILLGVLFLAGGWALEKARRRLVARIGVIA